ncbi:MAG: DUF58 domain-containing protein [Candidatus Delongbacteria bacterium]|nr:DUF58 domain-containing protein [Candidatus Delongbacteria bacterium]
MSADFFYNTYSKFSKRGNSLRLKITAFGIIVFSVCIISGFAGLNIFVSELYRISALSFSLIIISYFSKIKKFPEITAGVFFDKQFHTEEPSKYGIKIFDHSNKDLFDLEIIPVTEKLVPSKEDFINIKEPEEQNRNLWDRHIYYFRWIWHILKLHKADFHSIRIKLIKAESFVSIDGDFLPVKRGKIKFDGFYVVKKDLFGIFTSYKFFEAKDNIVILPKKTIIETRLKKQILTDTERKNRSSSNHLYKHKIGDFIGLRDYVPGDPFKNIHWKTWAKTDKPAVIEKGVEKTKEYLVVLLNLTEKEDKDFSSRFEDCLSYLFSTVKYLEENEFEIIFYHFDKEGNIIRFDAEKDKGNYAKLNNILAELDYYDYKLKIACERVTSVLNRRTNSMIFAPESDPVIFKLKSNFNSILLLCGDTEYKNSRIVKMPRINNTVRKINLT